MTFNPPKNLSKWQPNAPVSPTTYLHTGILLAVVFTDAVSYSLILPVMPGLARDLGGDAAIGGLLLGLHALASLASAPLLGAASDRYGSRVVLIATLLGAVASQLMLSFSSTLVWVVMSRGLNGAMVGNLGVVQASLTHDGSINEVGQRMAWLTATWAIGLVCGPSLSMLLAILSGPPVFAATITAAGATTVMAIVTFVAFRPGYKPRPRRESFAFTDGLFWRLCPVLLIAATSQAGLVGVSGFHVQALFGWSAVGIGALLSVSAAAILVFQLSLVQPGITLLGEVWTSICACFCVATLLAFSAFWMRGAVGTVLGFAAIFGLITVAQTGVSTLIARRFDASVHGTVFGSANAVSSAGRILGPTLFGLLYSGPFGVRVFPFTALLLGGTAIWMLFAILPVTSSGIPTRGNAE